LVYYGLAFNLLAFLLACLVWVSMILNVVWKIKTYFNKWLRSKFKNKLRMI
jgi:hypothetical protein